VETISRTHTFHAHFSLLFTIGAMAAATCLSGLYHHLNPLGSVNVGLIYILTIILISYHTDKYRYGILAAIFSVFCINYLYTYPFYEFNFMMVLPVIMVLFLTVTSREYMEPVFTELAGKMAMTVAIIMFGLSYLVGSKLMKINV